MDEKRTISKLVGVKRWCQTRQK